MISRIRIMKMFLICFISTVAVIVNAFKNAPVRSLRNHYIHQASYIDDLSLFRGGEKKCLVGLTTVSTIITTDCILFSINKYHSFSPTY